MARSLVEPQEILQAQRYTDEEQLFVSTLILAAEAFLENAGAMRRQNNLTPAAIHLIVGFWLDNREANYSEFNDPKDFPLGIRSIIVQLQYQPEDEGDPTG